MFAELAAGGAAVILRLWRHDDRAHVEEQLSRLCSAALGYEQPVRRD